MTNTNKPLVLGIDYRELSPEEGKFRWRFVTLRDVEVRMPWRKVPAMSFEDRSGVERMCFETGGWRIMRAGYAWNGCSPKRYVRGVGWVGTPDTLRNRRGSLFHDGGYQASGDTLYPLTREQEDYLFLLNLREDRFLMSYAWYGAVRDFGASSWGNRDDSLVAIPVFKGKTITKTEPV